MINYHYYPPWVEILRLSLPENAAEAVIWEAFRAATPKQQQYGTKRLSLILSRIGVSHRTTHQRRVFFKEQQPIRELPAQLQKNHPKGGAPFFRAGTPRQGKL